jgi:preprotein translocase subunit SecF
MLELVPPGLRIDFLGKSRPFIVLSIVVILVGLVSIVINGGLRQGIDFSGGILLHLGFKQPVDLSKVRTALEPVGLTDSIVQHFGNEREVLIRAPISGEAQHDIGPRVQQSLQNTLPEQTVEVLRVEIVGPQVSTDLRQKALLAIFYSVLGIVIYLSGRFEAKWLIAIALAGAIFAVTYPITLWFPGVSPTILIIVALVVTTVFGLVLQLYYALAALVAIYHDVLVTVTFLSLFNREFDLQIVAALLTIIGYSLNDTIVIFDRIRENMRGRRREEFPAVVNRSLNETLSRTILTSGLTLLVVLSLFFLGGEVIHDFAFSLLVGLIAGAYSTVFIATPLLAYWHQRIPFQSARKATATSAPPTSASSP